MLAARNTSSSQMYSYCLGAEKTTAGPTLVGGGKGRKRRQNWNNERSEFIVVFNFLLQMRLCAFIFMTVPKNYSLIVDGSLTFLLGLGPTVLVVLGFDSHHPFPYD